MYLKSIEMHGFKSFAGRMVLTFNEGITGIVGPNGSGKSNISDAVRWVLGEQSARTLRGANMQDVIFTGTESRKALSFAYVCLTLDNSDHVLPLDYDEISVSRRIYRSGESEYMINKAPCRLKDIQELFYDTGVGKEGYSIIGQGQIERILSSKSEDRREIFDEAVGIVKYKKRKEASLKRLEEEESNLERINEVLSDLTERIEPLKQQSEKAKRFLSIKERQKALDINLFLLENKTKEEELSGLKESKDNLVSQLEETEGLLLRQREAYTEFSRTLKEKQEELEVLRQKERSASEKKGEIGQNIRVLEEKIRLSQELLDNSKESKQALLDEIDSIKSELSQYNNKLIGYEDNLKKAGESLLKARAYRQELDDKIKSLTGESEELNKSLLSLKDERIEINSEKQKYESKIEQANIQKASITKRQLEESTRYEDIIRRRDEAKAELEKAAEGFRLLDEKLSKQRDDEQALRGKIRDLEEDIQNDKRKLASLSSKRETIRNIAERYEGYGNAVKSVMKSRDDFPGIHGVVADLFKTSRDYETAIETALGGAIQNIVTEDEPSAKECVEYLKRNHLGRATFLPITAVKGRGSFDGKDVLRDSKVIGLASNLIDCEETYRGIFENLLGRVVVCEDMDNALRIARENNYRLNIVTLEGDQLRPGGSITGGRFKNSSNLLGRNRELDELKESIERLTEGCEDKEKKLLDFTTALELMQDDLEEIEARRQEASLLLNTAKINYDNESSSIKEYESAKADLLTEKEDIESQVKSFIVKREEMELRLNTSMEKEESILARIEDITGTIDESTYMEDTATRNLSEVQIEEANAKSEVSHTKETIARLSADLEKATLSYEQSDERRMALEKETEENRETIERLRNEVISEDRSYEELLLKIETLDRENKEYTEKNAGHIDERDRLLATQSNLEKEGIRLDNRIERLDGEISGMRDHIWNEYELTYHNAMEYRNEDLNDSGDIRGELFDISKQLREMGSVNVDAIEEYDKVKEKYEFLTSQSNDLIEGRDRLLDIIKDLDTEMKERFEKGFAEISKEFDRVFKELFGGGEGILKLSDDDVLESGITIIAQPPGKKLSNLMQMSGGEKALTAIAILFAILNLKPSPFCLLDEIEAALDEQNVDRFANYLSNLTGNTQFIIITHRRGTMNAANSLYGITMQEKGISTLVSVSLIEDELS